MRIELTVLLAGAFALAPISYVVTAGNVGRHITSPGLLDVPRPSPEADDKLRHTAEDENANGANDLRLNGKYLFTPAIEHKAAGDTNNAPTRAETVSDRPILIGLMTSNGKKIAVLKPRVDQNDQILLSVGERMGIFQLVDIAHEQITVKNTKTDDISIIRILAE